MQGHAIVSSLKISVDIYLKNSCFLHLSSTKYYIKTISLFPSKKEEHSNSWQAFHKKKGKGKKPQLSFHLGTHISRQIFRRAQRVECMLMSYFENLAQFWPPSP